VSVKEITYYQAVCDRCGKVDDEGEYSAYSDPGYAIEVAQDGDWHTFDEEEGDQGLYCGGCVQWDEEADEMRPKPLEVAS
jgi:hypothetical protein